MDFQEITSRLLKYDSLMHLSVSSLRVIKNKSRKI